MTDEELISAIREALQELADATPQEINVLRDMLYKNLMPEEDKADEDNMPRVRQDSVPEQP
jgi:hypothetical protein